MTTPRPIKPLVGRGAKLFMAVLVAATIAPQILGIKPVAADDGGYPWVGATQLFSSTDLTYDWGYSTCPSNSSGCMGIEKTWNNTVYGEEDPYTMEFRNCTSYAAWKINQYISQSFSGWGDAASWNSHAPSGSVKDPATYTPVFGDLAQWGTEKGGGHGHVAFVYAVNQNGIASLDEYNSGLPKDNNNNLQWGLFYSGRTTASSSAGTPDHYIHFSGISSGGTTSNPAHDLTQFYVSNGSWVSFNVSNATGVQINGNPFEDSSGTSWAKDNNGHLRQFYVGSNGWTAFDVSNATGVNIGGDPYVDSTGTVWARGTNNHLYQFYVYGGAWNAFDVSNTTGVSIAGTPIVDSGGAVWARDTNGHLRQFYVSGGSWTAFDVSNATGVNIASNVALANGAEFARDTNNHLRQFYVSGSWTAFDVSNATGVNVGANPVADSSGAIWIDDTASHLRQFYVSGSWVGFDVSYAAGNVTITGDPGISSAGNFAEDSNGSLRQFYVSNGSWVAANIGGATGVTIASNPASGTSGEFAEAK